MKRREFLALGVAFVGLAGLAHAADKPDPTGTWKWSSTFNDQTRVVTLKFKLDGDTLTGAMLGRDNQETKIDDATFKDGEVAFSVTRERNGQKNTTKYKGKLDGDAIKGTIEMTRDGNTTNRDWNAKREKA